MTDVKRIDPMLHLIRVASHQTVDEKQRSDFETARYQLYRALSRNRTEAARNWVSALKLAFNAAIFQREDTRLAVSDAINTISKALNE